MKSNNDEAQSLQLVPKKFLEELSESQERIITLLTSGQPQINAMGDYIPESEASKLLGRKTTWFWNLRKTGKLAFTKVGNRVWYARKDILALLDNNRRELSQ